MLYNVTTLLQTGVELANFLIYGVSSSPSLSRRLSNETPGSISASAAMFIKIWMASRRSNLLQKIRPSRILSRVNFFTNRLESLFSLFLDVFNVYVW